jgi:hypothetical protein
MEYTKTFCKFFIFFNNMLQIVFIKNHKKKKAETFVSTFRYGNYLKKGG